MEWCSGVRRWGQPIGNVETVDRGDIDAAAFRAEFVDQCKPLVIRSATKHWPAASRWREPDYIARKLGDGQFIAHRKPVMEMRWRKRHWPDRFAEAFATQPSTVVSYAELAELAASDEVVFAYAMGVDESTSLAPLKDDVGNFAIVPRPGRPNYYKPLRAFVHGMSYTDWHYHPDDNTLMCQFGRSKIVSMLPPDQRTWDVIYEIARQEDHIGPADPDRYAGLKTLEPVVAVTHPGDAIYIPPNWWHAVQCQERAPQLGVTLAYCWGSPLHIRLDPRFPFHRFYLRHGRLKRRLQLAAAAVAWYALAATGKSLSGIPGTAGGES